jgi:hypothetical protein
MRDFLEAAFSKRLRFGVPLGAVLALDGHRRGAHLLDRNLRPSYQI